MAVNELSGFLKYKDENGDTNLLYPITTKDNVDGIDELESDLAETVKFTAQALNDIQKAQARTNISALSEDANVVYCDEEDQETATVPLNADTFGGYTLSAFLDKIYPVGSIYTSTNSTSPASFIGGSWERIKDTFLLSAGDVYSAGSTGGEAKHTLTVNEMPSHSHTRGTMNITGEWTVTGDGANAGIDAPNSGTGAIVAKNGTTTGSNVDGTGWTGTTGFKFDASKSWTGNTSYEGNSQPHNNMPPYTTVYMWKRTA